MGEEALVADKYQELTKLARVLEGDELSPRALIYASYPDTADEKLLVVPASRKYDERDVYRRISITLAKNRSVFPSIDISDVRVVNESDPYVRGLSTLFRVDEFSTIRISKSVLNGVYVENAVVYRMVL